MNRKRILKYIRNLIIFFFASTILSVVALRFIPVYITPLMVIRSVEQLVKGEKVVMKHKWVPKEKISRHLPMAVIASEDNRFASHNGFDFKEISKAIEENKKRKESQRSKYHQPADSQECIPMALFFLDQKRLRSVFHGIDRTDVG